MTTAETSLQSLSFKDGDEVLLTHLNGKHRIWAHGVPAFSSTVFHDDHIEFRQLNDDGIDLEKTGVVEDKYRDAYFRTLGDVAYKGIVLFEKTDEKSEKEDIEEDILSIGVPYPRTLESFRQRNLIPLGAHSFPLAIHEGDQEDGEFSVQTIMQALVDKTIPIGANPGYFVHDMSDHSIGMAAIDRQSMKSIRSFALLSQDLAKRHPFESHDLAVSVAGWLDYYSYFKFFADKMAVCDIDPMLANILASSRNFDEKYKNHMRKIVENNGFKVSLGNQVVRSSEILKYYRDVIEVLDPVDAGNE